MFDIGWGELIVIGIVALIAIGQKELPTVLRTAGQWMGKIRRMATEFQGQFQEALREAEMADLKKQADELKSVVTDATSFDPLAHISKDIEKGFEAPKLDNPSAVTDEPAALSAPAQATPPDLPTPEPPAAVTEKDFASAEPPPKTAGGKV